MGLIRRFGCCTWTRSRDAVIFVIAEGSKSCWSSPSHRPLWPVLPVPGPSHRCPRERSSFRPQRLPLRATAQPQPIASIAVELSFGHRLPRSVPVQLPRGDRLYHSGQGSCRLPIPPSLEQEFRGRCVAILWQHPARCAHPATASASQRFAGFRATNSVAWGNIRFSASKSIASLSVIASSISSLNASA